MMRFVGGGPSSLASSSTCSPDRYIDELANQIKAHERALAASAVTTSSSQRPSNKTHNNNSSAGPWLPLGLSTGLGLLGLGPLSTAAAPATTPITLTLDPHHLYYLLLRFDSVGLNPGILDINLCDNHSRSGSPKTYDPTAWMIGFNSEPKFPSTSVDRIDSSSLFSNLSGLSLGSTWWSMTGTNSSSNPQHPSPVSIDDQVKYLYSTFTKLPSLRLSTSSDPTSSLKSRSRQEPMQLLEGFTDLPNDKSIPLNCFKATWTLIIEDLDPRSFIGWDKLSQNLRRLEIRRSGLVDVDSLLIDSVMADVNRESKLKANEKELIAERAEEGTITDEPLSLEPTSIEANSHDAPRQPEDSIPIGFPSSAWSSLQHLCLADNALTFFPSNSLKALVSLTSLDLSSNLLIAVPNGLGSLSRLRFLNLSDNMIESVLGIYQHLGSVTSINLSKNRITSLCGIERLYGLERLDMRSNQIHDITEISRLATLPRLKCLWISSNPLCDHHRNEWRTKVFEYFATETRDIDREVEGSIELSLDNMKPNYQERKSIERILGLRGMDREEARRETGNIQKIIVRSPDRRSSRQIERMSTARSLSIERNEDIGFSSSNSELALHPTSNDSNVKSGMGKRKVVKKNIIDLKASKRKASRIIDLDTRRISVNLDEEGSSGNSGTEEMLRKLGRRREGDHQNLEEIHEGNLEEMNCGLSGDLFRKKIEALKDEVGESWLKVLGESGFGN